MRLDGESVKTWLFAHGEKIVLGIVGLVTLILIGFAFTGKGTIGDHESAAQILRRAQAADVERQANVHIPRNAPKIPPRLVPLYPEAYRQQRVPLIIDCSLRRLRREPLFVAATDVRARIVRGHLGVNDRKREVADGADDEGLEGDMRAVAFRVAVVTALVPVNLQRSHYDDAFLDTKFPEGYTGAQDIPEYHGCVLERAEVRPGVADAELTWTAVHEAGIEQPADDLHTALNARLDTKLPVAPSGQRLLRLYDVTVEPGKKYTYRVRLVLRNPNRGFADEYLQGTGLSEGEFRIAPASAPSPIVVSPPDVQVLAGPGVAPRGKFGEPAVKLLLSVFAGVKQATDRAMEIAEGHRGRKVRERRIAEAKELAATWENVDKVWPAMEQTATRGMVLDVNGAAQVIHPLRGVPKELKVIAFDTGHCLVDFLGGPKGPAPTGKGAKPPEVEPAQVLLLDADGRLVIRDEAQDKAAYQRQMLEVAAGPAEKLAQ